jgi:transaldolase
VSSSVVQPSLDGLGVALFADGADLDQLRVFSANPLISGFTTNPTLMRKAGIRNYEAFAREAAAIAGERPISFEVFSDDFDEMISQAMVIHGWGGNVYVKVPITDTDGRPSTAVVRQLVARGVKVNVTALATLGQVERVADELDPDVPAVVSVFAGRIADTGRDPMPIMRAAAERLAALPFAQLLWASPRELLNVFQAAEVGCDIVTATNDILGKLPLIGKDLLKFSRETVQMFHDDAVAAGFTIDLPVATGVTR